jgi:hypothetical protein
MAEMVKPIDGVAERDKMVDHVPVPSGVFAQAMDDEHHRFGAPFRKPGLIIDRGVSHALEMAFDMLHRFSFQ